MLKKKYIFFCLNGPFWHQMESQDLLKIGFDYDLLPDHTRPLPEPMLTDQQLGPVTNLTGKWSWKQLYTGFCHILQFSF